MAKRPPITPPAAVSPLAELALVDVLAAGGESVLLAPDVSAVVWVPAVLLGEDPDSDLLAGGTLLEDSLAPGALLEGEGSVLQTPSMLSGVVTPAVAQISLAYWIAEFWPALSHDFSKQQATPLMKSWFLQTHPMSNWLQPAI